MQALVARWAIALLVVLIVMGGTYWAGGVEERAKHRETKATHAEALRQLADRAADVAAKAAAASKAVARERKASDERLKEATDAADREARDLRDALRRGEQRLHERWVCAAPGPGTGGPAGDAGEADPAGRFDSAARIAHAADHDAAVIEWLWESWRADRAAVIAAGCAVEAGANRAAAAAPAPPQPVDKSPAGGPWAISGQPRGSKAAVNDRFSGLHALHHRWRETP